MTEYRQLNLFTGAPEAPKHVPVVPPKGDTPNHNWPEVRAKAEEGWQRISHPPSAGFMRLLTRVKGIPSDWLPNRSNPACQAILNFLSKHTKDEFRDTYLEIRGKKLKHPFSNEVFTGWYVYHTKSGRRVIVQDTRGNWLVFWFADMSIEG